MSRKPSIPSSQESTVIDQTVYEPLPEDFGRVSPGANRSERPPTLWKRPIPPVSSKSGLGPMVEAAQELLILMTGLKNTVRQPDAEELRRRIIDRVHAFRSQLQRQGADPRALSTASYVLCTAIDDVVFNNTRWGRASVWREHSLLVTLHQDSKGGKRFFEFLNDCLRHPADNRDLLKLMYCCLALGFRGIYRDRPHDLEGERARLYQTLREIEPAAEPELSPHWQGFASAGGALRPRVPLWVVPALVCALLSIVYSSLLFSLFDASEPVRKSLADIEVSSKLPPIVWPTEPRIEPQTNTLLERMRGYLEPEIVSKKVEVFPAEDGVTVRLLGRDLFPSARATLNLDKYGSVVNRVAAALDRELGRIQVVGHTDNVPIRRSTRFRTNYELSEARANDVRELLSQAGIEQRRLLPAKGVADEQPLPGVNPDTREGQALNRRVEITILAQ